MTEMSPEEWGIRYRNVRGTYEAMTGRLHALVVDLLAEANIEVIQIEARTWVYSGDWASFAAKTEAWHGRKRRRRAAS